MLSRLWQLYKRFQLRSSPQLNLVLGFLLYTIIGWLLLCLPVFHNTSISILDNLFISTSAISTTGLVTVSVGDDYNFWGQLIIMALIQVGGIGYMTLTTYYLLLTTSSITRWHQKIIGTAFTMPKSIQVSDFLKSVILFTLIMELLGAAGFYWAFRHEGVSGGQALWDGVFHSVSAFCTAGFGLYNNSFEDFKDHTGINLIISILAICGSLGFIVITDLWYRIRGKTRKLTFTTMIILVGFLMLLAFGTLLTFFSEPQVQDLPIYTRWLTSFFQSMTAMTTVGFNTISTGALTLPILLSVVFLMYIGASPSGTAGGMKITTLTAMISILKSRLKGDKHVSFMGRRIPYERLYVATATFVLYTSIIFLATFLMSFTEKDQDLEDLLFEVASALGTVGLSVGVTGELSVTGKVLMIILMFTGRVGVLTFGFALLNRKSKGIPEFVEDDIAV
ncbi:MAG: TrkH family potassium uptake protein [Owenweeksia sp.]